MRPTRVGAIASFVLFVQFVLTLLWIMVSWPPEGLSGLARAMAGVFRENATDPFRFALMNLYNVSFALSALTLVVVLRRQFADYPYRMDFVFSSTVMAAALYVASGVVPLVAGPDLVAAGDDTGVLVLEGIGAGLLLAGTMASGFAVFVFAAVGFSSQRMPSLLAGLMLVAGIIETIEWAVPAILILDPLLGAAWSIWLGSLLWTERIAEPQAGAYRVALGDGV